MNRDINVLLKTLNYQIKEVDAIYYKIATCLKLSESAFWILYTLADTAQECSQQDISRQLSISRQTVNSAIQSLVQKGYIFLECSSNLSRKKNIKMTDKNDKFYKKGRNYYENYYDKP